MGHYVHHVKGRLRIKTPALRRNEQAADRLRAMVVMHREIGTCEINTVTGSVVLTYDPQLTSGQALIQLLQEHGYTPTGAVPTAVARQGGSVALDKISSNVSKAVAGFVVEKLLERSAMAVIGAIL